MPERWDLTQNFRTHNGILFLARNIIEMIEFFFPSSIDSLEKEHSLVSGPRPICLSLTENQDIVREMFGDSSSEMIDFGAEQVILVRDQATKTKILAASDKRALVLTVLEAKG